MGLSRSTNLGFKEGSLPHAEAATRESLALPIYPELGLEDQEYVVKCIAEYCAGPCGTRDLAGAT